MLRDLWPLRHWFLTIENNNLNIHIDSSIKSYMGQHSQFLWCFLSNWNYIWRSNIIGQRAHLGGRCKRIRELSEWDIIELWAFEKQNDFKVGFLPWLTWSSGEQALTGSRDFQSIKIPGFFNMKSRDFSGSAGRVKSDFLRPARTFRHGPWR